ncbi:ATP-dependent zinc metalloprotease FtsH [bacterium]|nr:ATP-dependent zinc metalloprotease FtsH [bacterium]
MILIMGFLAYLMFNSGVQNEFKINYTTFIQEVNSGNIDRIKIRGLEVRGTLISEIIIPSTKDGTRISNFKVVLPAEDKDLPEKIWGKNPDVIIEAEFPGSSVWVKALATALPLIALFVLWFFFMRQMQTGGNKAFSFGKSRAKLVGENKTNVTFDDVAGVDEAKEELQEIIDFLKDPHKFQKLGGRIPKGVILLGPPGTGKTLLARAVAGEADSAFFSMSGSDFVEMFVGVGASRVRDLFEKGQKHAPCILFIDELDAVGRQRGSGLGGGHDEREQTLNQLLVEMDGFNTNEGVILLAATNRPDVLDSALLRPGRFDRRVIIDMPDLKGRLGILKVHTRDIPLADNVNLEIIARGTPGMSGADLANTVNEAALLAAKLNKNKVEMEDLEEAKDKVRLGPERKSHVLKEDTRKVSAFHESGHVIVGSFVENADPLHKVTIIPRGQAGGLTFFLPKDDIGFHSKEYLLDIITTTLGGRASEELFIGKIGTGAENDISRASSLARKMVARWGMSEKLGPISFDHQDDDHIFLGKQLASRNEFSEDTAREIDNEVIKIITECHQRAKEILKEHEEDLHNVATALLKRESLNGEEIKILLGGGTLEDLITHDKKSRSGDKSSSKDPLNPKDKSKDGNNLTKTLEPTEKPQTSKEGKTTENNPSISEKNGKAGNKPNRDK